MLTFAETLPDPVALVVSGLVAYIDNVPPSLSLTVADDMVTSPEALHDTLILPLGAVFGGGQFVAPNKGFILVEKLKARELIIVRPVTENL